ncbi:hypothetical protein SAMN05444159_6561 [Bradyrhizobium lablabi]|uniref:Uncharacterized protein n=1 Tax=Bradyrhizobium lablabi TaxID=722472 RepID=A0A1M7CPI7_9BRAD|nr:hypothetical protein SAMN05444159_6561 [Bradyrhizobium lablabi]
MRLSEPLQSCSDSGASIPHSRTRLLYLDSVVAKHIADSNSAGQRIRWMREAEKSEKAIQEPPVRKFHYEWDPSDYDQIRALLPQYFPDKDDVINAIFISLLEGTLERAQVKEHVRRFVGAHDRLFPDETREVRQAQIGITGCPTIRGRDDNPRRHCHTRFLGLDASRRPERVWLLTPQQSVVIQQKGDHSPSSFLLRCPSMALQASSASASVLKGEPPILMALLF